MDMMRSSAYDLGSDRKVKLIKKQNLVLLILSKSSMTNFDLFL